MKPEDIAKKAFGSIIEETSNLNVFLDCNGNKLYKGAIVVTLFPLEDGRMELVWCRTLYFRFTLDDLPLVMVELEPGEKERIGTRIGGGEVFSRAVFLAASA